MPLELLAGQRTRQEGLRPPRIGIDVLAEHRVDPVADGRRGHDPYGPGAVVPLPRHVGVPVLALTLDQHAAAVPYVPPTGAKQALAHLRVARVHQERGEHDHVEGLAQVEPLDRAADRAGALDLRQHLRRLVDSGHREPAREQRPGDPARTAAQFEYGRPGRNCRGDDIRLFADRQPLVELDRTAVRRPLSRTRPLVSLTHPNAHVRQNERVRAAVPVSPRLEAGRLKILGLRIERGGEPEVTPGLLRTAGPLEGAGEREVSEGIVRFTLQYELELQLGRTQLSCQEERTGTQQAGRGVLRVGCDDLVEKLHRTTRITRCQQLLRRAVVDDVGLGGAVRHPSCPFFHDARAEPSRPVATLR